MTDAQKRLKLMKKQVPPFFFINFTLDFELSYMLSITPTIMLHITYTIHISIYIFLLFNESHFLGCRCISWKEEKMMTSVHMFFFIKLALKKKEKNLAFQKHSFGLTILHFGHFSVLIAKKTELLSGNAFYILFADYLPFFHLFSSIVYVFDLNFSRDDIVIKSNRMTEQN